MIEIAISGITFSFERQEDGFNANNYARRVKFI